MTALALAATAASATPGLAAPAPARPAVPAPAAAHTGHLPAGAEASSPVTPASGRQAYFVQFDGSGAAQSAARVGGRARGVHAAQARRDQVASQAGNALAAARRADSGAARLFTVSNALPGMGIRLDAAGVRALSALPGVVKVTAIVAKTPQNANVASLVKAVDTWKYGGNTGRGVRVGIIDTGIDFTHADFGGVGTAAAYDAAHASSTAYNWRASLPALGKAKVVGGYDFAGDEYNADDPAASVPNVDPDPLDCNGHGTHVSGTTAGYGVGANHKVFRGSYKGLDADKLMAMDIGPGMAPQAQLYGLKVFGCEGSTNEVIPALDYALDPNGDGDFSDHLDIVNMSLGSDYAPVDDPENDVINALSKQGVLSVVAMGNNGDLTDTGGAPGNAVSSLAVASSVDALQQRDGLEVNAPGDVAGISAGQMSAAYDWPNNGPTGKPVTGDVAAIPGDNADGCAPFSADEAAKVAGKVAWLVWDDNDATRRCGSVGRSGNARAAGAIGAIFTSERDVFGAGITGDKTIPVFQLPKAGTDKLGPAAEAGTLNVTFDGALQATIKDVTPSITDTLSSFSSRGPHGSVGVVKPDVTAVGDTVSSASMGTGNQVLSESGTSMATPVTTGVSALVKAAHPSWTPGQVKTAVMNTARHDLFTGNGHSGKKYAPARVGAGRIDARAATTTQLLASVAGANSPVSASFGVVPAPIDGGVVTRTRSLKVRNYQSKPVTVGLSYQSVNASPGVSYTVSPSTLTVRPGRTATATVTMRVVPTALRHTLDATMDAEQVNPYFGGTEARQFVSDSSGRLLVKPSHGPANRVPVYGAAKPTSSTTATLADDAVELSGTGVDTTGADKRTSEDYTSLASVMELGATSPQQPLCTAKVYRDCASTATQKSADLRYVGASSNDEMLNFGLATYGDWSALGAVTIPYVDYDTTGDGKADYETYLQNIDGTDLLYAWTVNLATNKLRDLEPVNLQTGNVDTNVFDSNVVTMSVYKPAVGLATDGTSAPITYTTGIFSAYGDGDSAGPVSFDAGTPTISTADLAYEDQGGSSIPLTGTRATPAKALVLHLHGARGARTELLDVPATPAAATTP